MNTHNNGKNKSCFIDGLVLAIYLLLMAASKAAWSSDYLSEAKKYNYVIVNDDLRRAYARLEAIVRAEIKKS